MATPPRESLLQRDTAPMLQTDLHTCLDEHDWQDYLSGRLPAHWEKSIASHLESCSACQSRLREDESETRYWSIKAVLPGIIREPECDRLRRVALSLVSTAQAEANTANTHIPYITVPPGYEYLGLIDEGGMGMVYRARHLQLQRVVAIKTIRMGFAAPDDLNRLRAEAIKLARLKHPHIVQIHDVGEVEGLPYFTMEYVGGGTLLEAIRTQRTTPRRAAEMMCELALAMQYAHDEHVIHRDLKPRNILLTEDNKLKITDFGLAKLLDAEMQLTRQNDRAGTAAYMAPEQIRSHGKITHQTDVYGLGATMYELLTGQPPFTAQHREGIIRKVLEEEPLPPSTIVKGLPVDLEAICLRCLQKDPTHRYASAAAFHDDLEQYLAGLPTKARPLSQLDHVKRWLYRHRLAAITILTLLLVAIGAGQWWRIRQQEQVALRKQLEFTQSKNDFISGIEHLQHFRYETGMGLLQQAFQSLPESEPAWKDMVNANMRLWSMHRTDQTVQMQQKTNVTCMATSRGLLATGDLQGTIRLWNTSNGTLVQTLRAHDREIHCICFSQNGKLLASGGKDSVAAIWQVSDGTLLKKSPDMDWWLYAVHFVNDDDTLLIGHWTESNSGLQAWNWKKDNSPKRIDTHQGRVTHIAVDPNQSQMLVTSDTGKAQFYALPSLVPGLALHANNGRLRGGVYLLEGHLLATGGDSLRLWDPATGQEVRNFALSQEARNQPVDEFSTTDRGQILLARTAGNDLVAWNFRTQTALQHPLPRKTPCARVLGDHSRLAVMIADPTGTINYWSQSSSCSRSLAWPSHRFPTEPLIRHACSSHDSDQLLAIAYPSTNKQFSRTLAAGCALFDCQGIQPDTTLLCEMRGMSAPCIAAQYGDTLATGHINGEVRLWQRQTRKLLKFFTIHRDSIICLQFTADGEQLLAIDLQGNCSLFEVKQQTALRQWKCQDRIHTAEISPDGTHVVTAGMTGTAVWNLADGSRQAMLKSRKTIKGLAFSARGELATISEDPGVQLWNRHTGENLRTLPCEHEMTRLLFAPDGKTLLAMGQHPNVTLIKMEGGSQASMQLPFDSKPCSAAFHPKQPWIAIGDKSGKVTLWCPRTRHQVGPTLDHGNTVNYLFWNRTGTTLHSMGGSLMRSWTVESEDQRMSLLTNPILETSNP